MQRCRMRSAFCRPIGGSSRGPSVGRRGGPASPRTYGLGLYVVGQFNSSRQLLLSFSPAPPLRSSAGHGQYLSATEASVLVGSVVAHHQRRQPIRDNTKIRSCVIWITLGVPL